MLTADFNIEMSLVSPNVDRYMKVLAVKMFDPKNNTPLRVLSQSVANDSAFTYANLVYHSEAVALACCIVALKFYNLPLPGQDKFDYSGIVKVWRNKSENWVKAIATGNTDADMSKESEED